MSILWNSHAIREASYMDATFDEALRNEVARQWRGDKPSPGDTPKLLERYNDSSPEERDAMDAAFVWLTGYTLESLAARAVAGPKGDPDKVKARWRRRR